MAATTEQCKIPTKKLSALAALLTELAVLGLPDAPFESQPAKVQLLATDLWGQGTWFCCGSRFHHHRDRYAADCVYIRNEKPISVPAILGQNSALYKQCLELCQQYDAETNAYVKRAVRLTMVNLFHKH